MKIVVAQKFIWEVAICNIYVKEYLFRYWSTTSAYEILREFCSRMPDVVVFLAICLIEEFITTFLLAGLFRYIGLDTVVRWDPE